MPQFNVTQNRKPWNQAAEWTFKQAKLLAENADREGIKTVEQFAKALNIYLASKAMFGRDKVFQRGAESVKIYLWNNNTYAGINKSDSTDRAALVISLEEEGWLLKAEQSPGGPTEIIYSGTHSECVNRWKPGQIIVHKDDTQP